jgi:glutamate formiminotransferase/formiminotetrahydrofolate cyclodeaminase
VVIITGNFLPEVFMPAQLVECIPNFSEARRPEIIETILNVIRAVPEIQILNRQSDTDHNRTVITFVGTPQAVEEAAFQAIAKAAELIDLNQHTGEHPRIGAADVVPFVPIANISMKECIEIAHRLGKRVGDQLEIPVYLYEEAALTPERRNLEDIRRGQFEELKEEISVQPERAPDFGPKRIGPAGATIIGARHPLIAFNVYLTTSDINIAQHIAKAIRNSSGGLRYVKALGFLVEGRAQVSMNLTHYRQTPLARVVEMIRREAARYGVSIHHSELVGLIPQQALFDAAIWYLQLDNFKPEQVLEQVLAQKLSEEPVGKDPSSTSAFLDKLAAGAATPGGGAAAAHAAGMAAALIAMAARLTIGKEKYAPVKDQMNEILNKAENLRTRFTEMEQADIDAFEKVMKAYQMPKDAAAEKSTRQLAIDQALISANQIQLNLANMAYETLELARQACQLGNINALPDIATGAVFANSTISSALINIRANCKKLSDKKDIQYQIERINQIELQANNLQEEIKALLHERGAIA